MSEVLIEQLQALLPPVSYDPKGEVLLAHLAAEGTVLGDALESLDAVEGAIFPNSAGGYIADWERTYELTPAADASQDERVQAVEVAMADLGGQSIPYFIRLAALYSVAATVEMFRVPVVGQLNAGGLAYSGDWPFTWRVDAPLSAYTNASMEARITARRPGNTDVIFGYGKAAADSVTNAMEQLFSTVHYLTPNYMSASND